MEQSHSHSPKEGLRARILGRHGPLRGHGEWPAGCVGVLRAKRRALMEGQEFEAEAVHLSLRSHLQRICRGCGTEGACGGGPGSLSFLSFLCNIMNMCKRVRRLSFVFCARTVWVVFQPAILIITARFIRLLAGNRTGPGRPLPFHS